MFGLKKSNWRSELVQRDQQSELTLICVMSSHGKHMQSELTNQATWVFPDQGFFSLSQALILYGLKRKTLLFYLYFYNSNIQENSDN